MFVGQPDSSHDQGELLNRNRLIKCVGIAAVVIALSGCVNDVPDANEGMKRAQREAEGQVLFPGAFEVKNLKRDNGWKKNDQYFVKYTYDLVTKVPYDLIRKYVQLSHVMTLNPEYEAVRSLNEWGLPENSPVGTPVHYQVVLTYVKSEKGWVLDE